jgi:hypothetical protein
MKRMLDRSKIDDLIASLGISAPGSNRGYHPEQIIKSFSGERLVRGESVYAYGSDQAG